MISTNSVGVTERSIVLINKSNGLWRWVYEDTLEYYGDKIFYSEKEAIDWMNERTKNCRVIQTQIK